MLRPHIVPLVYKNQAYGFWEDPNKKMIERCPIIPIEQHRIYHNRTDAELLEEMYFPPTSETLLFGLDPFSEPACYNMHKGLDGVMSTL